MKANRIFGISVAAIGLAILTSLTAAPASAHGGGGGGGGGHHGGQSRQCYGWYDRYGNYHYNCDQQRW